MSDHPTGSMEPPEPGGHLLGRMSRLKRPLAYGLAVVFTGAVLLERMALEEWIGGRPVLIVFLIPIIVSSYLGGLGPGLVATTVAALGADYFLIPPVFSLGLERAVDWTEWLILILGGVLVSGLNGALQKARSRHRAVIQRRHAQEEVRLLNAELERRVLERTAQLESANKEMEAFSYSVSHDLRAPLRAVDGFSQALVEDYGELLPEEGRRYLNTIRGETQRMGELIDDLLTFSRLSRASLDRITIDTAAMVRGILKDMVAEFPERKFDIRVEELPPCEADRALMKQVWLNLLSNAFKYTSRRDPAVIEIGSRCEKGATVYFVKDNGAGFDMRYANKLFGVFQRLHRAEDYEGTGVGLAIVQRIIHRHGGRVWAEGAVNQGATFYFTLNQEASA